jgi:hypothetical protein
LRNNSPSCKNFQNSLYEPLEIVSGLNLMLLIVSSARVVVVDMAGIRLGGGGGTVGVVVGGMNIVEGGVK